MENKRKKNYLLMGHDSLENVICDMNVNEMIKCNKENSSHFVIIFSSSFVRRVFFSFKLINCTHILQLFPLLNGTEKK